MPGYEAVKGGPGLSYGLERLDHAVSNVHDLMPAVRYLASATGESPLTTTPGFSERFGLGKICLVALWCIRAASVALMGEI